MVVVLMDQGGSVEVAMVCFGEEEQN